MRQKFLAAAAAIAIIPAIGLGAAASAADGAGTNGPSGTVVSGADAYVAGVTTESAKFKAWDQPVKKYTKKSCLFDISGLPNGSSYNSITGCGGQTVDFSTSFTKAQVPGGGWMTWSSPPESETATPHVMADYFGGTTVTLNFSEKAKTGGVEVEPNNFSPEYNFTVDFYAGADGSGKKLGSISRDILGDSGARLFGATAKKGFQSIVITGPAEAAGFAFAQVRGAK